MLKHEISNSWSSSLRGSATLLFLTFLFGAGTAVGQTLIMANGATFSTCSGVFYDTGGPSGNYSNNQDLVSTICPSGGAGSGPNTSVTFTTWSVQGGTFDQLFIHDGPTTASPLLATGNGSNSLLGSTFTATGASGCLTFRWVSNGSVTAAGWAAQITTGPSAGTNASHSVCSNAAAFNMTALLGGTPDAGGVWTQPGGGVHSATFDPSIDVSGVWTYTVSGPSPCPDSSATLTITKVNAANAGTSSSVALCDPGPAVQLFPLLGGSPQTGGTWTAPGGGSHNGTFTPGTSTPGAYTYTVTGTPPCANATATVTVTVNNAPNAGTNGSISVCSNAPSFSLFAQLGGSPQTGGAWTRAGVPVSATYTPGTSTPGVYTYTVTGTPPCPNSTATVNVTQVTAPDPGQNNSIFVCSDDAPFAMIGQLNGTPGTGGAWTGPGSVPHGPQFDPATDVSGTYTYTIQGTAPCTAQSAVLTVTVRQAPNAGTSATITKCSSDASFPLIGELGGSPNTNGTWTAPGNVPHSGTFVPGTDVAGVYTYTVTGQAPCDPAVATVTVNVNTAPNAGTNASTTVCSNASSFSLFALLGGSPNTGGTWSGPGGAHNGTFVPGTNPPGPYTYTVNGIAPCANASAVVTVNVVTAPNAGTSATTTVCSNAGAFQLINVLTGNPDNTGTWTAPGNIPHNGTFTPGTSPAGTYTYTVPGTAPCAIAVSTVTVNVVTAPNAGTNGQLTICSDDAPVALFTLLGGSPDAGGTWTRPGGASFAGTYNPANVNHPQGVYTYTVAGTAPCANATATVTVVENPAPNAGTNGSITVCSTNGAFDLFSVLGGTPNSGGTWINASNTTVSGNFIPGTTPSGSYRYIVAGLAPCENDTAMVTVNVNTAPNAGTNGSLIVCSNNAPLALIGQLGGTPNSGGTWTGPGGASNGTYTPGTSQPGVYTYTVTGQTPCANAQAVVVVTQYQQPNAGIGASVAVCSTEPGFPLISVLGGTPNNGGSWSGPGGANNGFFIPGTSQPGNYTYTVVGQAPCANATATVNVVVDQAPNAGTSGEITTCSDQSSVDLFDGLLGTPDLTGTWNDDDNTGQLSGEFFSPLGVPPGDYTFTYTVPGIGNCPSASSQVVVTVVGFLEAGTSGMLTRCANNTQVNLFNGLGGSPQTGGEWLDLDNTNALNGQFFNATLVPPGTYHFRYRLVGTISCASDSAQVTLTTIAPPNAGIDGTAVFCSNGAATSLFPFIGGTPQNGGVWKRPNNSNFNGVYNPVVDNPGVFRYVVGGTAPCVNDTAFITVTEVPAPNAGTSASRSYCSNGSSISMLAQLGGSPQNTGTWTDPNGIPHGDTFQPGLDIPGTYIYTVTGSSPCAPAIATLTISVSNAPDAGSNSSITVCSSAPQFLMINALTGSPQTGGTWTGPGGTSSNGTFTPGTSTPGDYTYKVTGTAPCQPDSAVLSVFVNDAANAGSPGSLSVCANGPQVNLFNSLGGTPDPTGTWVGPNAQPFNGTFVPGSSLPGTYTYTVQGIPPCANASSTVSVSLVSPANAGISTAITVCSNGQAFALVDQLAGNPALNGTWTGPNNQPSNGVFIPGSSTPGCYTYTVTGGAPCPSATATVCVTVNTFANAGNNGSVILCSTSGQTPLFPYLSGGAQTGGSWFRPDLTPHTGTFVPGSNPPGPYRYVVYGTAPCANDTSIVTVTVNQQPNAGSNGLITICSSTFPFPLIDLLNGTPALSGSWRNPLNAVHTGIYIPGVDVPGIYTYTVNGVAPCPNASATVTVFQNQQAEAGNDRVVSVCSDDVSFQMVDSLGGTPDNGGQWYAPGWVPFSGTFVPGTSQGGIYNYVVTGLAPCTNDTSRLTVIQSTAPNAGFSTAQLVCTDQSSFPLIDLLAGTPQAGGFWLGPPGLVPHNPVLNPQVDVSGQYAYVVVGTAPCINDTAFVQVTLVTAPNAGADGTITACVSDPAVDLFMGLGAPYDAGGTWTDVDNTGALSGSSVNATSLAPGTYQFNYTVDGVGPCSDDVAILTLQVTQQLDAGTDTTIQVCDSQSPFALFPLIGGDPQPGGAWLDVNGSGALANGVFSPATAGIGTFQFRYLLTSQLCASDTSFLTIEVADGPNAGCQGFVSLCTTSSPFQLISAMGCGPDAGGTWLDPLGDPHSGTLIPATGISGSYTYVLPGVGLCPADSSIVVVNLAQAPFAGDDGAVTICANAPSFLLFDHLGGSPQAGGSWFIMPGMVPHNGIFNPLVDMAGTYKYVVTGTSPCAPDEALVTVTVNPVPNAGGDNNVTICSNEPSFSLFTALTGSPQQGGSWFGPNGLPHGVNFNPSVDTTGAYVYVVFGVAPCPHDTAVVFVNNTIAPDPGISGTLPVCINADSVDLFNGLGGTPDTNGTWLDASMTNALNGNLFDATQVGVGQYVFLYVVAGVGQCANDTSVVLADVGLGADAGIGGGDTICGGLVGYDLFLSLGGTPTLGGLWTDDFGIGALIDPAAGTLDASLIQPGTSASFTYTITDPNCGTVSSTLLITASAYPDPGGSGEARLCQSTDTVQLASYLTGAPEPGGIWRNPNGVVHGPDFIISTHLPGEYTYTLPGNAYCADTSSTVTVTVSPSPYAGENGSIVACDTLIALELFPILTADPQIDGKWTELTSLGRLSNGSFYTVNAPPGDYFFQYTVEVPGCGSDYAVVTVTIVDGVQVDSLETICNEEDRTYTVRFLLSKGDSTTYSVTGTPGELSPTAPFWFVSDPIFTSEPYSFVVDDQFGCDRQVIEGGTPCTFEEVVFVPGLFSPNGDGINDQFIIPGIEGYKENTISIFNRWGDVVYSATGYDNRTVRWDGTSDKTLIEGELPTGTYFYVLDLGDAGIVKGYVYLNR